MANFAGRPAGYTGRIRWTNKVGSKERKSIWQRLQGSHIGITGGTSGRQSAPLYKHDRSAAKIRVEIEMSSGLKDALVAFT